MIDRIELDDAIAELEHARNHSPSDIVLLASCYTVRDHLFGELENIQRPYSLAAAPLPQPEPVMAVPDAGDSEFLHAVSGKDGPEAWKVMDGLMDTLKVVNPKVYDSIMRKIRAL